MEDSFKKVQHLNPALAPKGLEKAMLQSCHGKEPAASEGGYPVVHS